MAYDSTTTELRDDNFRNERLRCIGQRVRILRKNCKLTQNELAKKMMVSRVYISEIENGKRRPPGPLLVALESIFSANKSWIMTGRGKMLKNGRSGANTYADRDNRSTELVRGFRRLSDDGREKMMSLLRVFTMVEKDLKRSSKG